LISSLTYLKKTHWLGDMQMSFILEITKTARRLSKYGETL